MPTFRCTKKLLDQFEIKTCSASDSGLDDWHANLLLIERRKLILFCSDQTLFCCVSEPFTKNQNKTIEAIFLSALETAMRYENFSDSTIDHTLGKYQIMAIGKTNNRSVLGSMNDYTFHLQCYIESCGGLSKCSYGSAMHQLNIIPQVKREFFNSLRAFKGSLIHGVD